MTIRYYPTTTPHVYSTKKSSVYDLCRELMMQGKPIRLINDEHMLDNKRIAKAKYPRTPIGFQRTEDSKTKLNQDDLMSLALSCKQSKIHGFLVRYISEHFPDNAEISAKTATIVSQIKFIQNKNVDVAKLIKENLEYLK